MQNQLPLFLSFDDVQQMPIIKKYQQLFAVLDLSHLPEFNYGVGAGGTSQHALLRAFIIKSLESLNRVSALIRFLEANPALKYLCGFRNAFLPDESQFYRFPKKTKNSVLQDLLARANKILIEQKVLALELVAIDSKPVRALTKHNNPKNIRRNQRDKTRKPKRNPAATLGYYSYVTLPDAKAKKNNSSFSGVTAPTPSSTPTRAWPSSKALGPTTRPTPRSRANCSRNSSASTKPRKA